MDFLMYIGITNVDGSKTTYHLSPNVKGFKFIREGIYGLSLKGVENRGWVDKHTTSIRNYETADRDRNLDKMYEYLIDAYLLKVHPDVFMVPIDNDFPLVSEVFNTAETRKDIGYIAFRDLSDFRESLELSLEEVVKSMRSNIKSVLNLEEKLRSLPETGFTVKGDLPQIRLNILIKYINSLGYKPYIRMTN